MRETRRVLKMLREELREVQSQAEQLGDRRQRLETAIQLVEELEQKAAGRRPSEQPAGIRAAILEVLEEDQPRSAEAIAEAIDVSTETVMRRLDELLASDAVVREGDGYRTAQPPLPRDESEGDGEPPE